MKRKNSRWCTFPPFLVILLMLSSFQCKESIKYFQEATVSLEPHRVIPYTFTFQDSTQNDTLFQVVSSSGLPVSYFRKIQTAVCFDNKCRALDIVLHWNITGRYLGFELPAEEYLSKTDHDPFKAKDYQRMQEILSDPRSALGGITYNQLVLKPEYSITGIDGVTAATAPALLDHIVEGAAYTTFTLWHLVYGDTKTKVMDLTKQSLSADLALKILESPVESDRMWALNNLKGNVTPTTALNRQLVAYIDNSNYSLSERAINALLPEALATDELQLSFFAKFNHSDYSLKKLILEKLKDAPLLAAQVKKELAGSLATLSGELVSRSLELFKAHHVSDAETLRQVATLLKHDNAFIAKKAYDFLAITPITDKTTQKQVQEYALQNGLKMKS